MTSIYQAQLAPDLTQPSAPYTPGIAPIRPQ